MSGISLTVFLLLLFNNVGINKGDLSDKFFIDTPVADSFSNNLNTKGKIDLNGATISDLDSIPGIGKVKAAAIIAFRETYGNFEDVYELSYIDGIGENLVVTLNEYVYIKN